MKAHFQRMAVYNRWANQRLYEAVGKLSPEEFAAARSGFFPSLLKTLNHILVGDAVWMGRLEGTGSAGITSLDQVLHAEFSALKAARAAMDERIVAFVDGLAPARLKEDLVYHTMAGEPMTMQVGQVLAHFFNHQTHHRGQAHAMLSSTTVEPPVLDLIYFLRDHPGIAEVR
ncbi:DinB family protein [Dongia deserti]|uniref:DinB family protein n=1 Tax=Dongia deserti TaxID=2268030 RepID=UPI000E64BEDB|nr:DinB family protein [Dongia deserti]